MRHPLLTHAGRPQRQQLLNRYFDTPDLALQSRRIALRIRKQGKQWLQTVKCEGHSLGGLSIRPEWETPYRGRFDFTPITDSSLRDYLQEIAAAGNLIPLFDTDFTRTRWHVPLPENGACEVMLDQGWIVAGDRREEIAEIEIEQSCGDILHLFDFAQQLAQDVTFMPAPYSKAERGFRLRANAIAQAVTLAPPRFTRGQNIHLALRDILGVFLDQLQRNYAEALRSSNPEFIHQARVAIRRLQTALKLFAPLFPTQIVHRLRDELRTLKDSLGRTRELDVLLHEIIEPMLSGVSNNPPLQTLHAALRQAQSRSRQQLHERLAGQSVAQLLLALAKLAHAPAAEAQTDGTLQEFVLSRIGKLRRRVEGYAYLRDDSQPAQLHRARIAIKHWRYAQWIFSSLLDETSGRQSERMLADLQADLGCIQDLISARDVIIAHLPADSSATQTLQQIGNWHRARYGRALQAAIAGLSRIRELPAAEPAQE